MEHSLPRRARPGLVALPLALLLAVAPPAAAQESASLRLRGDVTRIDRDILYLRGNNGQPVTILLAPDAAVTAIVPARLAEIAPGRFVGTAARPAAGDRWQAIEVHVFPPGSRPEEGHHPWPPEPGATMTNAEVVAAVVKADTAELTLRAGAQDYVIDVPKKAPIVAMNPGTRALLKKGAHVAINQAAPGAGGAYTAKSLYVTTVPNWPPR